VTPLVSVIIPTYNRADAVVEAIASVRSQTYEATEIIVVDDGSTDDTASRVRQLEGVKYLFQENAGSGAARTRGLTSANGSLVASLDSDDLWHPDFLERSVAVLEAERLDFVFANWIRQPSAPSQLDLEERAGRLGKYGKRTVGQWVLLSPRQVRTMFLRACLAPSSSLVLRRSSMPAAWSDAVRIADDWHLVLEMGLGQPCRAAFTTVPLWTKRINGTNKYDGMPPAYVLRNLYLHDLGCFRRDFSGRLSLRERAQWSRRHLMWRAYFAYLTLKGGAGEPPGSTVS
jgi:glycosyltransferase involved in cell wall biosynthesis